MVGRVQSGLGTIIMALCHTQMLRADLSDTARRIAEQALCEGLPSRASRYSLERVLCCFFCCKTVCASVPRYSNSAWVNHNLLEQTWEIFLQHASFFLFGWVPTH
jgi:hypothetical protein